MVWRVTRTARLLAASSLSLSFVLGDIAAAQTPPPPAGVAAAGGPAPPARVGRLTSLAGTVSFHAAASGTGADAWVAATQNFPVTTGDGVFAQVGGHAEIDVGNDLIGLDGGTELDMATLDDTQLVASEPQGRMFLAVGPQASGAVTAIATPRGTLQIAGQGEYEIVAGDSAIPTTVTVVQGAGTLTATGLQLAIAAGQTATVTGSDQLSGSVAPAGQPDPFLNAMLAALSHAGDLPPAVSNMTGCRALATTGSWRPSPQYGRVWYPPVQAGWAPYREGHWAWVQPWGWTWIDNESWGFAPFHYGRWIDDGGQWGWVPEGVAEEQDYPQPVYAPALVDWTDVAAGAVAGAAIGALAAGAIGWAPLAPNEPYYPPYRSDRGYFDRINRVDVRNIRNVSFTRNDFGALANRRGATIAPRDAVLHGQPIRGVAHGFTPAAFQQARGLPAGHAPIGAPPTGLRQGTPAHGPAIQPALFHPQQLAGHRVPFRTGAAPGAPAAFRPGVTASRGGLPALRSHAQVETGRPGPAPPIPGRPEAGAPTAPPGDAARLHPGPAGAAAGAVGAGLAAHALTRGPAAHQPGPTRPNDFEPHAAPPAHPIGAPRPAVPPVARPEAPRAPAAPHVQAPRPPQAHVMAPRPQAPRPQPQPAFRPPAPRQQAPRPAPHFAPPRAAPPRPPAPRPAPARPAPGREPPHR